MCAVNHEEAHGTPEGGFTWAPSFDVHFHRFFVALKRPFGFVFCKTSKNTSDKALLGEASILHPSHPLLRPEKLKQTSTPPEFKILQNTNPFTLPPKRRSDHVLLQNCCGFDPQSHKQCFGHSKAFQDGRPQVGGSKTTTQWRLRTEVSNLEALSVESS